MCEDVALATLAETAGTPCYVYSASRIIENYARLEKALLAHVPQDRLSIRYAAKANGHVAVLKLIGSLGAGADIVSRGEMLRALHAGIKSERIVFSGVGKTDDEIAAAIDAGIGIINVESHPELTRISAVATARGKTVNIALRINPDVDAGTHAKITTGKKENKFGIDIDVAAAAYTEASAMPGIRASGIAIHIGSQLMETAPFAEAFTRVAALHSALADAGIPIDSIDLGGGIGIPYRTETPPFDLDAYAKLVGELIAPLGTRIIVEPGRFIIGDAGALLSRVVHVKETAHKKYLILDAGMNDLARPALYDAYHAVLPCTQTDDAPHDLYDIVGPVCETGDTFVTNEKMPALQAGDIVALMDAGAYGASMASTYNARPLPAEIMVKGDKTAVIRARETVEDAIRRETVPNWA